MVDAEKRFWTTAAILVAGSAFAAALISQYGFGWLPCPLCIFQRYPYAIGGGALVLSLAFPPMSAAARGLCWLAALAFLGGAALGVFHTGVEFLWWDGLETCSAPDAAGMSADDFLTRLETTSPVRCDERRAFLFGLSMANWNVLVSLTVAISAVMAATDAKSLAPLNRQMTAGK